MTDRKSETAAPIIDSVKTTVVQPVAKAMQPTQPPAASTDFLKPAELLTAGRDFSKTVHPVQKPFQFELLAGGSDKMPRIAVTG